MNYISIYLNGRAFTRHATKNSNAFSVLGTLRS